ncbi:MAG: hypothetical protein WC554_09960, partial [Clostridia bacterium]
MTLITPNVIRVVINPNLKFASGSIVSAVNTGDGEGSILKSSFGGVLTFKTLQAGDQINVINNENEIVISSSGNVPNTRTINGYELTSDITLTKDDLSLDQVDNTADIDKPLSSASIIALGTKVDKNENITPGTFTKITFDAKGLVTKGTGSTTFDIEEVTDKRYVTDNHLIILGNTSGVNTGDETQTTIKQKLGSASISQDGYLTKEDYEIFNSGSVGQNIGDGNGEVYKQKTGSVLEFKTIKAGNNITISNDTNEVTINSETFTPQWGQISGSISSQTDLYNYLTFISGSVSTEIIDRINSDNNLQSQITTLSGSIVSELNFKEDVINKSSNTDLGTSNTLYPTQNAVKVYVDSNIQASSSITTASNIGTGATIFDQKIGNDLQFKSLVAGNNIIISSGSTEITISSTASGSTGTDGGLKFKDTFIGDGTTNIFNLSGTVGIIDTEFVYLQGLLQAKTVDYTITGSTLTMIETPLQDRRIDVYVFGQAAFTGSVTASNIGTGTGEVYSSSSGSVLQFKTIKAGTNITISNDANEVTINSTASGSSSSGSVTTASNLGSGEGIFGQKVGDDLQFKSLIAGTNITLS